jgi:ribosomal protein RSM22 (predicted rRNA methylase)
VTASLNALREIRPDFAPASLLDIGAGPGTAAWAAAAAFPSLTSFALLDANSALRTLALDLGGDSTRLRKMTYRRGEARAALADSEAADLVIASYMIGEIGDAERTALAELMWAKTRDTLLIVEPGTSAGYRRIIALRRQLIAAGANVAAPCPHDRECPLRAPDWCHFTQRLPRSRAHKQLKSAELPYEDEKFSYVALSRAPAARHPARVIAQPVVTKVAVTARLCTDQGILNAGAARRQKAAYQRFKKIAWGDAIFDPDHGQAE